MYMFQQRDPGYYDNRFGSDWTVPINPRDWSIANNVTFDPLCITESPHYYLKDLDPEDLQCGNDLTINLIDKGSAKLQNEFCRLLQFYKLKQINNRIEPRANWVPREWLLDVTFQVPQGQFVQKLHTGCPTYYEIIVNKNHDTTGVHFYTNSTVTLTVNVEFIIFGDTSACNSDNLPKPSVGYPFSINQPIILTPKECGTQVFFLFYIIQVYKTKQKKNKNTVCQCTSIRY